MKDEKDLNGYGTHEPVKTVIDKWVDYYNNDRYQWDSARLSPNEYYEYLKTGIYPLPVMHPVRYDHS